MRVEPGAHRGAADRQTSESRLRRAQRRLRLLELVDVAREFLSQRKRRRVLQVRAPDLDQRAERVALLSQRVAQRLHRRQEIVLDRARGGDVHGGGKHVVRRLAHVDVVVRVHEALLAALAAEQLGGAVGEHFVDVHVALRTGAGLPHGERELGIVLARDDFGRGALDRVRFLGVEESERVIGLGSRLLHRRERVDHGERHALGRNAEEAPAALGLRAPQPLGGDLDRPEAVLLDGHAGRYVSGSVTDCRN